MYTQSHLIHYIHVAHHFTHLANEFTGLWLIIIVAILFIGFICECIVRNNDYIPMRSITSASCLAKVHLIHRILGGVLVVFACIELASMITADVHGGDLQAKPATVAEQDIVVHDNQTKNIPHNRALEKASNRRYMQLKSHPSEKYNLMHKTETAHEHHVFYNAKHQLAVEHSQDEHNDPLHESIITQRTGENINRGGYVKLPKLDHTFTHFPHFYQR